MLEIMAQINCGKCFFFFKKKENNAPSGMTPTSYGLLATHDLFKHTKRNVPYSTVIGKSS